MRLQSRREFTEMHNTHAKTHVRSSQAFQSAELQQFDLRMQIQTERRDFFPFFLRKKKKSLVLKPIELFKEMGKLCSEICS